MSGKEIDSIFYDDYGKMKGREGGKVK